MLATTTTDTLSVVDPGLLKKGPSSIPSCLDLIATPVASSWSPDNVHLFIASSRSIHKYDPSSNVLRDVYSVDGSESIRAIVPKDRDLVIFSMDYKLSMLDCSSPDPQITGTLASHKTQITSLSLSNDNSLLASASMGTIFVHNLASGSHTTLRGCPGGAPKVMFHMHARTRLLASLARQILVYDTTRPSGPLKIISLSDSVPGDIVTTASSPFSKTLVAVATSMGFVVMIDLEKEKAQVRTLNVKATPTTLEFSPEGGAIYLGTEDGKLLIVDLRSLDKPAKTIIVSEIGDPIRTLNMQRKVKVSTDGPTKTPKSDGATAAKTPSEPLPPVRRATVACNTKSASKVTASPIQRAGKTTGALPLSLRRLAPTTTEGGPTRYPLAVKASGTAQSKTVLSPAKDPHGNTNGAGDPPDQPEEADELDSRKPLATPVKVASRPSKDSLMPRPSPSPRVSAISAGKAQPSTRSITETKGPRRTRTLPSIKSTAPATPNEETKGKAIRASSSALCVPGATNPGQRLRATSSASRGGIEPTMNGRSSQVPSSASTPAPVSPSRLPLSSISRPESSRASSSTVNNVAKPMESIAPSSHPAAGTRTPSPVFPDTLEPVTPASKQQQKNKKRLGMNVLGLGTPEVERWIKAGQGEETKLKGKGKSVGFKEEENLDPDVEEVEELLERARKLSLQISPRRPVPSVSGSTIDSWAALAANSPSLSAVSPNPANSGTTSSGPMGATTAHDLLKTIVQDVMFDYQRETKAEMMGLHLDLLRMGRNWKAELRCLMDEYVGDLREMREENERLRKENDRLRRGWP